LGPEHPQTLFCAGNLATNLRKKVELNEAARICCETLQAMKIMCGEEHAQTLFCASNYATVLSDLGKRKEATDIQRETLQALRCTLGTEHPQTLVCANNLAGLLRQQGEISEAVQIYSHNLEVLRRLRGREHPDTRTCMSNLELCELEELQEDHRCCRPRHLSIPDLQMARSGKVFVPESPVSRSSDAALGSKTSRHSSCAIS